MSYDSALAERVGKLIKHMTEVNKRKMFGGICYTYNGNMAWGVKDDNLIVRVGADSYDHALGLKHALPFDVTGRPMTGFVFVEPEGVKTTKSLQKWVDRGFEFVSTLPAK